jgi:glutamate dehydrogenase/leucine dehydrogenase
MKVVALSDNSGGVYRADGLIVSDVNARLAREQVLFAYTEAEHISRAEVLKVPCDALVLTSGSNEFNETNCGKLAAEIVVEAEYNAIGERAKELLASKKISVLPWFLATCGTLVACYFEAQRIQILARPQELLARCYGIVGQAAESVLQYGCQAECSVEQAAYRLAVEAAANYLRACGSQH